MASACALAIFSGTVLFIFRVCRALRGTPNAFLRKGSGPADAANCFSAFFVRILSRIGGWMPLTVTTLPVKKCSGNDRSHFQNTNINIKISAENGQSATATTAACGRNREELLGPRPARCECRSKARSRCRVPQPEYFQRKNIFYLQFWKICGFSRTVFSRRGCDQKLHFLLICPDL